MRQPNARSGRPDLRRRIARDCRPLRGGLSPRCFPPAGRRGFWGAQPTLTGGRQHAAGGMPPRAEPKGVGTSARAERLLPPPLGESPQQRYPHSRTDALFGSKGSCRTPLPNDVRLSRSPGRQQQDADELFGGREEWRPDSPADSHRRPGQGNEAARSYRSLPFCSASFSAFSMVVPALV